MKQILALALFLGAALGLSPVEAQPTKVNPTPTFGTSTGLVMTGPALPQAFLQPETMRYALWATHQTRRRMDAFRQRFPAFKNGPIDQAIAAATDLENSLKDTLKAVADGGVTADVRAAVSAEKIEAVRKSLAFFEAASAAPEVRTFLESPAPELGEERARQSLRQLSRLVKNDEKGWPNSPSPYLSPQAGRGVVDSLGQGRQEIGAGASSDEKPLKAPADMELLWNNMPDSLASVARSEYQRAYNEAYFDSVTGIHARRYLDHHAAEFAKKDDHQLVGDIDHFKKVNDEMGGHQIGDATLKVVATIWGEETAKAGGVGVRWGGEEFWGGVPGGQTQALEVARSINARVRDEVHKKIGLPRPLTISVGVAGVERRALHTQVEDFHATFKRADDAVFHAKHQGRDRVVLQAAETFAVMFAPATQPYPGPKTGALAFLAGLGASLAGVFTRRRK